MPGFLPDKNETQKVKKEPAKSVFMNPPPLRPLSSNYLDDLHHENYKVQYQTTQDSSRPYHLSNRPADAGI